MTNLLLTFQATSIEKNFKINIFYLKLLIIFIKYKKLKYLLTNGKLVLLSRNFIFPSCGWTIYICNMKQAAHVLTHINKQK